MQRTKQMRFTLIELLVVISIIGILMTLLMPSLSKAKQKVEKSACLNNMKGLGTGVELFMMDGDLSQNVDPDHYPPYYKWTGSIGNLLNENIDMTKGSNQFDLLAKFWQCPSPQRPIQPQLLRPQTISYGINTFLTFEPWLPSDYRSKYPGATITPSYLKFPSETALISESGKSNGGGSGIGGGANPITAWHGSNIYAIFVDGHAGDHNPELLESNSPPYINYKTAQ